jgi:hypothetical protein
MPSGVASTGCEHDPQHGYGRSRQVSNTVAQPVHTP